MLLYSFFQSTLFFFREKHTSGKKNQNKKENCAKLKLNQQLPHAKVD